MAATHLAGGDPEVDERRGWERAEAKPPDEPAVDSSKGFMDGVRHAQVRSRSRRLSTTGVQLKVTRVMQAAENKAAGEPVQKPLGVLAPHHAPIGGRRWTPRREGQTQTEQDA